MLIEPCPVVLVLVMWERCVLQRDREEAVASHWGTSQMSEASEYPVEDQISVEETIGAYM